MKVSVLTPIYRTEERFLRASIESVLAQTFRDFEFLLLDDCPEDDRERIVRSYDDPRIVYLKNERNLGITPSRNRLIDLAKGEYLAVFDHDDVCLPERFAEEVAYLDAHPECGVVSSWTRTLPKGEVKRYPENDHDIKLEMMHGCALWHPASMIRRDLLVRTGIRYEAEYSPVEDYMLWLRLTNETVFHNLPKPLIEYRWHDGNTSIVRKAQLEAMDLRCKAWAKVHLPELWEEHVMRRKTVWRIRLCGLPLAKLVTSRSEMDLFLFNSLPLLSIARRYRMS